MKNGLPHGQGFLTWKQGAKNGDTYEGEWENGLKKGKGVWISKNGETYTGDWANDKREGHGVWKDGK